MPGCARLCQAPVKARGSKFSQWVSKQVDEKARSIPHSLRDTQSHAFVWKSLQDSSITTPEIIAAVDAVDEPLKKELDLTLASM